VKYINTEDLILKIMANTANNPWILLADKDSDLYHLVAHTKALAKIINEMPPADVVDVETLKTYITNLISNIPCETDYAKEDYDAGFSDALRIIYTHLCGERKETE